MIPEKMVASDWVKCINRGGSYAPLIPVVETSEMMMQSREPITFMEFIQRAKDRQGWLVRPGTGAATA